MRLRESGIGRLTLLVFGALITAVGYSAYHILPFYYYYYEIQNQMEQLIRVADVENDKNIRNKLMYHVRKYQIPMEPEDLVIERNGRFMKISLPYQEVFSVPWRGKDYDIHVFSFHAYAEGSY